MYYKLVIDIKHVYMPLCKILYNDITQKYKDTEICE